MRDLREGAVASAEKIGGSDPLRDLEGALCRDVGFRRLPHREGTFAEQPQCVDLPLVRPQLGVQGGRALEREPRLRRRPTLELELAEVVEEHRFVLQEALLLGRLQRESPRRFGLVEPPAVVVQRREPVQRVGHRHRRARRQREVVGPPVGLFGAGVVAAPQLGVGEDAVGGRERALPLGARRGRALVARQRGSQEGRALVLLAQLRRHGRLAGQGHEAQHTGVSASGERAGQHERRPRLGVAPEVLERLASANRDAREVGGLVVGNAARRGRRGDRRQRFVGEREAGGERAGEHALVDEIGGHAKLGGPAIFDGHLARREPAQDVPAVPEVSDGLLDRTDANRPIGGALLVRQCPARLACFAEMPADRVVPVRQLATTGPLLEPFADGAVQALPPRPRHVPVHGLGDRQLSEPVGRLAREVSVALLDHEAAPDELGHRLADVGGDERGDERHPEPATGDRGNLEHLAQAGIELLDARKEQLLDALGQSQLAGDLRGGAPLAGIVDHDGAAVEQVVDGLFHEQRDALRERRDLADEPRRHFEHLAEHMANQLRSGRVVEGRDLQDLRVGPALEPREIDVVLRAHDQEEQDRRVTELDGEVPQQRARGRRCPVMLLQHEDERAPSGEPSVKIGEPSPHRDATLVAGAHRALAWLVVLGDDAQKIAEDADDRLVLGGEHGGVVGDVSPHVVLDLEPRLLWRVGVRESRAAADRLEEGLVRRAGAAGRRPPELEHHVRRAIVELAGELGHEPALPDAGAAAQRHHAGAMAGGHGVEGLTQRCHLGFAADQVDAHAADLVGAQVARQRSPRADDAAASPARVPLGSAVVQAPHTPKCAARDRHLAGLGGLGQATGIGERGAEHHRSIARRDEVDPPVVDADAHAEAKRGWHRRVLREVQERRADGERGVDRAFGVVRRVGRHAEDRDLAIGERSHRRPLGRGDRLVHPRRHEREALRELFAIHRRFCRFDVEVDVQRRHRARNPRLGRWPRPRARSLGQKLGEPRDDRGGRGVAALHHHDRASGLEAARRLLAAHRARQQRDARPSRQPAPRADLTHQLRHEILDALRSVFRRLREAAHDRAIDPGRQPQIGSQLRGQQRRLGEVRDDHPRQIRRVVRQSSGQQLAGEDRQRIDVRTPVDHARSQLLGRHVVRRSDEGAVDGEIAFARQRRQLALAEHLREPEVDDLDEGVVVGDARNQHVPGLEIAVDDAVPVSLGDGAADLREHAAERLGVEGTGALEARVEAFARHVLHHDEPDVRARHRAERVDDDDVRVVQPREQPRFATEPRIGLEQHRGVRLQQLDRDRPIELAIGREQHRAHAALTELADDLVLVPEKGPRREIGDARLPCHSAPAG